MLGHDASFAYVHAVKLTHEKNLFAKRIGYLTCNLFLHKEHEFMLLLINTIQRDLQSANHLEVCSALTSVCRLVNLEMIPAISPLVFKLLSHQQEMVRKKAILAVHRFYKLSPEIVLEKKDEIRKVLCDPDPSVMGASLHILCEIAKGAPSTCKDLVPSFVSILKQITEHRLPRDFDYHRMPAPWMQVKLISILSILGTADEAASQQMYEILQECMRRADSGVNIGHAIVYECVKCVTRIYSDHALLELAASNISRFISSDNHNLKYLGVTGLALIVQVNASYAADHQMVVVDCLEDPDETLKRKTLDLLFRMTNPQNVLVVVDKLTFHLRTSVDTHLRRELVQRVTSLAERFAPNNEWYVTTMNSVFELGGDLVPAETAYNLMRLVAEGTGENDEADAQFRAFAVNTYVKLLEKSNMPDVLVQVIAWVLGEYARHATLDGYSLEDIIDLLCECIERPFEDQTTRGYLVTALMKNVAQNGIKNAAVDALIQSYRSSRLTDLQQRCYEFEQLQHFPNLLKRVLPYDASCEDLDVNPALPFLNAMVQKQLNEGSKPYMDASERESLKNSGVNNGGAPVMDTKPTGLNFTPYELPSKPQPYAPTDQAADQSSFGGASGASEPAAPTGFNVSSSKAWGPSGYNQPGNKGSSSQPESRPQDKPAPPSENSLFAAPKSTPAAAASKPAETEAQTEKQRMAAALFGGIGGGGPAVTPAPVAAAPKKAPEPAQPAPRPAPPAAAAPAADFDLLDFGGGEPAPSSASPAPAAVQQSNSSAGNDLLDMGGLDGFGGGPPAPVAPAVASLPVAAPSLLGPLQMTTQQVGAMWGQLAAERRVMIQTSMANCQEFMRRLQTHLNVQQVDIIGVEGIAAGRVLPGNDPCFFHGKLNPPRLELLIRTRDAGVAQQCEAVCSRVLV
jgi:AP-4 complex subunit epsilon-1